MPSPKNPFGLHTVTPYLVVTKVGDLIEFLIDVFGAVQRGDIQYRDDGSVQHAEIEIGDSVVMLGEPDGTVDAKPAMLYVYVDDCDDVYNRALSSGAKNVLAPENYPHGDRYGGFEDASGNTWWAVTHIGDNPV